MVTKKGFIFNEKPFSLNAHRHAGHLTLTSPEQTDPQSIIQNRGRKLQNKYLSITYINLCLCIVYFRAEYKTLHERLETSKV